MEDDSDINYINEENNKIQIFDIYKNNKKKGIKCQKNICLKCSKSDFFFITFIILINIFILYIIIKKSGALTSSKNTKIYIQEKEDIKVGTSKNEFQVKFSEEINFLQSCLDEARGITYDKPELSIIIPFNNDGENIKRLIKSIQNQKIKKLEIIIIDNASTDKKSLRILDEESKNDKRIKIIKNKKIKGDLYSYAKGINEAKGNYSMLLNSEQMLLSNLNLLYNISRTNEMDINEFSFLKGELSDISEINKVKDSELHGQKIVEKLFSFQYSTIYLYNKIYKTDLLKYSVKTIKDEYLNLNAESKADNILFTCIFYRAESYKSFSNYYIYLNIDIPKDSKKNIIQENHNLLFEGKLYTLEYISDLNYSSKDMYNKGIRFGRVHLDNLVKACDNKTLIVDWNKLNQIINKISSDKDLSEHNEKRMNELKERIKVKAKNVE